MRLLFDRHLGPSLVQRLADLFPDSQHVDGAGLSTSRGHPPKVISVRIGNCTIAESADLLRRHSAELHTFESRDDKSLLMLFS